MWNYSNVDRGIEARNGIGMDSRRFSERKEKERKAREKKVPRSLS